MEKLVLDSTCSSRVDEVMSALEGRYPDQPDFLQAVGEVVPSLVPVLERHPEFVDANILERIVEPERIARIVTDDGSAAPFARLCVRKSNDRDFSYLGVPRQQAFPGKGRFLPGGTLVVRNVLSGGGGNAA